jgi:hypothetical protein
MNQTFSHQRGLRLVIATLFGGLMLCSAAPPAKAGELDVQLLGWARENVLYRLHEHNAKNKKTAYRNVGVLPFKVINKKNKGYDVAPISLSIVPRLENALILGQHKDGDVIGVVRDATSTASAKALKSYQSETCSEKDFLALFEGDYVRAWGEEGKKVSLKGKVDAFLTGVVVYPHPKQDPNPKAPRLVQIVFQVIDRDCYDAKEKRVKPKDLGFDMAVVRDREMMTDLGISFQIPPGEKLKRFLSRNVPPSDRDKEAVPLPDDDEQPKEKPKPVVPEMGGMTFKMYYKAADDKSDGPGKEQELYRVGDFFEAPPPPVGSRVSMVLTPKGPLGQMLGVVLKVNGQSIWQKQDEPSELCQKWLFKKGRTDKEVFDGFYFKLEGDNVEPFEVVDKPDAALGNKVGWIQIDYFAEGEDPEFKDKDPKVSPKKKEKLEKDRVSVQTKLLSSRSLGSPLKWDGKARQINLDKLTTQKLTDLQEALRKANNLPNLKPVLYSSESKVRLGKPEDSARSVITSSGKMQAGPIIQTGGPIRNPEKIGSILIRYDPNAKSAPRK